MAANKKPLKEFKVPREIQVRFDDLMTIGQEPETVGECYFRLLEEGEHPNWAEMIALQSAPVIGGDHAYLQDQNRHGMYIEDRYAGQPKELDALRKGLRANGYELKPTDHYIPTAAQKPNDPGAVVNETQSFSDLKKRVAERQSRLRNEKPEKMHRLNPRLQETIRQREIALNPDLAKRDPVEHRAEIVEKHGTNDIHD